MEGRQTRYPVLTVRRAMRYL